MHVVYYQKLTLLDYPGKISSTVFTQGCVFACPFCHNPGLISRPDFKNNQKEIEFFEFLESRKNKLEGVCITGGEPTVQPDLEVFIRKVKYLGLLVKLDSNGSNPSKLQKLLQNNLIDYVAMDIKHTPDKYHLASGRKTNIDNIKKSVEIIKSSGIDYEFRTTVVPTIHDYSDFEIIGQWLQSIKKYYLQKYRDTEIVDSNLREQIKNSNIDLDFGLIKSNLEKYIEKVEIRFY